MMKRILAMLMCLTLIFSSSNVAFAAENLGNEVAGEQVQTLETVTDTKATELKTVKIHVLNENYDWSCLNVYTWQGSDATETRPSGDWPGTTMELNEEHPLWYTVDISVDKTKDLGIKFTETGSSAESKNGLITATDLANNSEFWIFCNWEKALYLSTNVGGDSRWDGAFDSVIVEGSKVTFRYNDNSATSVNLKGQMSDWGDVPMTKVNGVWSYTFDTLKPGTYEYGFVVNGEWKRDPASSMYSEDKNNSVRIISGILLAEVEEVVKGDSIELPSEMERVSNKGKIESVAVTYALKDSTEKGVSINGNVLTVDHSYAKDKVQLTVSNEFGDTATLDVAVKSIPVDSVKFKEEDKTKSLTVGDTAQLNATITPAEATDKALSWESDKEEVATVDANGVVTAKEEGTATITVTTSNGKTDTCEVTVKDTITLAESLTLEVGVKDYALSATTNSENTKISWSSDKPEVVEVSENGLVTAKAVGTATITATTAGGATDTCVITVTEANLNEKVTAITLIPETLSVDVNKTARLTVTTAPLNKGVIWKSLDESVATVVGGLVTGVSAGKATIEVVPENPVDATVKDTCEVTVNETITVTPKTLDLVVGGTETITKTTVPETTDVTWTSSNESVATVDNTGKVTAVGYGTAIITATTAGKVVGEEVIGAGTDTVTVNVTEKVTLKTTFIALENGDTADLAEATEPTILATNQTLTWTSDNTEVATVENGVVTAKKVGTATLTATTENGATVTCVISVTRKLASEATISIHFCNQTGWQNVKAYLWDEDEAAIPGYEAYHTYPGKSLLQDQTHPQWFTIDVVVTDVTKDINVILSDNGNEDTKTEDIKIEAENFEEDGFHEIWVYRTDKTYVTKGTTTDSSWTNPFDSILVEDGKVTFRYKENNDEAGNVGSVVIHGEMNGWNDVNMTRGNDGVWSYTFPSVKAGVYKYRYIKDGTWITDPENGLYSNEDSVAIIPGIVLTDGVEAARGGSTKLPDRMQSVLANGEVESLVVSYELKEAVSGVSLSGNVLTVDEGFSGNKVQLTVSNKYEETATLDVAVIDGTVVVSPVVDDNAVTFNYRNATATAVYVAGSMTNWADNKVAMTKDPNTNIWSVTIPNMKAGTHQYKFVVVENGNETWITDPRNDNVGIEGSETNSLVIVKGTAVDTNKITVKIHYTGRTDYTKWNVWVWNDDMADQIDFEVVNGERIATIELEARASQYLKFIVRKGEWDEQEFGDRIIDLSDLLSGTAHVYVTSGKEAFTRELDDDALLGVKIKRADYDRTNNQVLVTTALPVEGNFADAFTFDCVTDNDTYEISNVAYKYEDGINKYILTLEDDIRALEDVIKYYNVGFDGYEYKVFMPNVYADPEFEEKYTYIGDDLGATWTKDSTTFKLWAPTADDVVLNLYESGTAGTNDLIRTFDMKKGDKGVWTVLVDGDYHGKYYTYSVSIGGKTTEACDPYARTTGVNGKRAMIINLDSTDPEGWADDTSPNQGMNQTDAIIYELHVRDLTIDESSGATNKGKFLGVTETGTTTPEGNPTGLDHIIDLGVTHIHFLPIYDYGSVDETKLDTPQFNWGYDPVNYNVPEGSYSTDPYNGEVRVEELKEMVQTLHENNINVIMDVVYNHVYDAGGFAFNQIVPDYFSRTTEDGNYSSRSGCGNDTASERDMVRKYIVESVVYWAEEYHLDGFRFDLVGLLDVHTINQIVEEVHKINPSIVFYGEGWDMDGTVMNPREPLAKQGNAYLTPGFAYFSDTIRDLLRGNNDSGTTLGYVSGATGKEEAVRDAFMARTWWTWNPTQIVNYASCHDNYTVMDKINEGRKDASFSDRVKMNNLSAAIYMLAEGVPLIHAAEEMLRTKVDEEGNIIHNSYKSSDYVNSIKWFNLDDAEEGATGDAANRGEAYRDTVDYYAGLIEFRKNHEALRLTTPDEVSNIVSYSWVTNEVELFKIDGTKVAGEVSDGIIVIFNAQNKAVDVNLATYGATGDWKVCIDDQTAGIDVLRTVNGTVTVAPISTLVLVKGETVDENSVYTANGYDPTPGSEPEETIAVTSVKLNKAKETLHVGDTLQLAATVNPSTATNKAVTWTSSNENAVTVDSTGKVTVVAETEEVVTITVTTEDGNYTATCAITVVPKNVPVTSVALNKTEVELKRGEKYTLTVRINPSTATNQTVTWTSSNEDVVTVEDGKLTAVAAGTAIITAEVGGITVTCQVTVTQPTVPVTGVTLNKETVDLIVGETVELRATVTPAGATDKTVTWTSSNEAIATVDENGLVTAVAAGTATITVKTTDGSYTATCNITVAEKTPEVVPVTSVIITNAPTNLTVGEDVTLTATVTPENATEGTVTWSTSDAGIATVDAATGKVTAVAAGEVTITAIAGDKTATCKITVVAKTPEVVPVTGVTITNAPTNLTVGEDVTLTATVTPENATEGTVTWSTSDAGIATVDAATGKVTAVAAGEVTITATAGDKSATCTINIKNVVHTHTFNKEVVKDEYIATAATCTSKATYYKSCECGHKGTETFVYGEVLAHVYDKEVVKDEYLATKATCTSKATYYKSCECGHKGIETFAYGDLAAHTWKDATTEAPKTCETCGATEGEPLKPAVVDVTSITLDKATAALKKAETVTLVATVGPENATDKTVTWTSSDDKVATVDANGKVTAVANGTATITAKAGDKTATCTITVTTDVASVKLNKSKANVAAGKTLTLTATIAPSDASNQTVTWTSSDAKIAAVDKNGKVTGKKAGTATITATTANGKKATCKVTVVEVTLNASTIPVQVGKTTSELKATSSLKGDKVASWVSSDKKIATVDKKTGKIKGIKVGTAKVTVTMKSGATATCKVTVQKAKVVTKKLIIDQKKVTLQRGKTVTLKVTRNPISATEKITWTTSNKKVATVDKNGKVKGVKAGTATITAKTSNGKKITCKVTVKNPTVKLAKTKETIKVGKTTTIKIKSTFPENDTVKSYKSSNKKVATVDKNGKVKGVKAGTATITVTMKSGAKATFKVTVKK